DGEEDREEEGHQEGEGGSEEGREKAVSCLFREKGRDATLPFFSPPCARSSRSSSSPPVRPRPSSRPCPWSSWASACIASAPRWPTATRRAPWGSCIAPRCR